MAKRLKLKLNLSRVIPSLQICRSKNPSSNVEIPLPSTLKLSSFNHKSADITNYPSLSQPAPPPSTPDHSFTRRRRHSSRKFVRPVGCGCDTSIEPLGSSPILKRSSRKKHEILRIGPDHKNASFTLSDDVEDGEEDDDDDDETESLLFTSRSFSYDSSCELSQNNSEEVRAQARVQVKKVGGRSSRRQVSFGRWKGKKTGVAESVAVVKKSEDPYEDFKRSMLEMILEKQMFEEKELEELLQCFLSLNSRQYHGVIVDAFSEIWKVLFFD